MSGIQIIVDEPSDNKRSPIDLEIEVEYGATVMTDSELQDPWHIPRPSLVGRSEKDNDNGNSWTHHYLHPKSSPRGSTSSQGSTASTHSAASGTLLLTAANLATLAGIHPPTITPPKPPDNVSVASSTHFTVVNGLGTPISIDKKSWCARHQLTVLVCTMSIVFMMGLSACVLWMEMRTHDKYN